MSTELPNPASTAVATLEEWIRPYIENARDADPALCDWWADEHGRLAAVAHENNDIHATSLHCTLAVLYRGHGLVARAAEMIADHHYDPLAES